MISHASRRLLLGYVRCLQLRQAGSCSVIQENNLKQEGLADGTGLANLIARRTRYDSLAVDNNIQSPH